MNDWATYIKEETSEKRVKIYMNYYWTIEGAEIFPENLLRLCWNSVNPFSAQISGMRLTTARNQKVRTLLEIELAAAEGILAPSKSRDKYHTEKMVLPLRKMQCVGTDITSTESS